MVEAVEVERVMMQDHSKTKTKRISVSPSRQITIPKEFFDRLHIKDEILCEIKGRSLFLTPIRENVDFSDMLLQDLIKEGFSGEELLQEFRLRKKQMGSAVERMIDEARQDALKEREDGYMDETEELFKDVLND